MDGSIECDRQVLGKGQSLSLSDFDQALIPKYLYAKTYKHKKTENDERQGVHLFAFCCICHGKM